MWDEKRFHELHRLLEFGAEQASQIAADILVRKGTDWADKVIDSMREHARWRRSSFN
jgi:hypothetical protein